MQPIGMATLGEVVDVDRNEDDDILTYELDKIMP